MEEIDGLGVLDKNGMVSKLTQTGNPSDKTLEAATRAYGFGPDSTGSMTMSDSVVANDGNISHSGKVNVRICSLGSSNPSADSQNGFDVIAKGIEETSVENAHLVVPDEAGRDEKEGDVAHQNEFDPDANKKVSENCISLFVDVFGPLDGFPKEDEQVSGGNQESGRSFDYDEVENPSPEFPQKGDILGNENEFLPGDLVWVRTKTKSWWPGQIIDPSYASNIASKSDQKASFLVKYIGNNPTVWCSPKQLEPFMENFEHMSSQGKSRVFLSAVKKAVDEYGRRIKAQMSCPVENSAIKEEKFLLDNNVLTQLEPVNFLYLVKNLALGESKLGILELAEVRSHLSVFYRSLGHHQLSMNQLHGKTDDNNQSAKRGKNSRLTGVIRDKDSGVIDGDKDPLNFSEVKPEKVFELRERKRSKYLSYPYIDLNQPYVNSTVLLENTTNGITVSDSVARQLSISPSKAKSTAKRCYTSRPQKPTYQPKAPITPGDLDKPSIDLLSKLRFAALDYVVPSEEIDFDWADRFFYGFRRWVFHDKYDPEVQHKHGNGGKSKNEPKSQYPTGDKPLTGGANKVVTSKRKRRKEEISSSSNGEFAPTSGVLDINGPSGSLVVNFEMPGASGPQNISNPKRSKKRAKEFSELVQGEIEAVLPNLNGNRSMQSPFVVNSQANNISTSVNKPVSIKRKKKTGPSSVHSGAESELTDDQLMNDERSSLVKESLVRGLSVPDTDMSETKKMEGMEKTPKTGQSTVIPDLNGNVNVAETGSQATVLPGINSAQNEAKPLKKRRRRNKVGVPQADSDLCFSKVFVNGESLGTALVMTFAQGFPVPSKEALIATFCGFGPLNESETKGLSDNRSAQVVFKKGSDAVEALKGIEKSSPFGPVLVKCRLHHLSPVPEPSVLKPCELKVANSPKETPDLAYIRKNLEMMTSMLEGGGDSLSAEMRAKLETEVKGLLKKVSAMVGSTSSS